MCLLRVYLRVIALRVAHPISPKVMDPRLIIASALLLFGLPLRYQGSRTSFTRTYTSADVLLDARYERLAGISVAHLYNLRKQTGYRHVSFHFWYRDSCKR